MKILIGCEESQAVCKAFRDRGHEAYSCDIIPCSGGHPEWHIEDDIYHVIAGGLECWDLLILHPPCTALAVSGNRWYGKGMPRHGERIEAIQWTQSIWECAKRYSDRVVLENPVSVIFQHIDCDQLQYIQPWQFGHGETKKTGLAMHNVPPLEPTNIVDGREPRVWKMAPGPDRKRLRSKTYEGIAMAMAEQWGKLTQ